MNVLWAPWRMEYILSNEKKGGCIFCAGEDRTGDEERRILYVGAHAMVVMNRYPYTNGHLLVAPVRHVSALGGLGAGEMLDLWVTVQRSMEILTKTMHPEGFNVGMNLGRVAGAGVEAHLHVHIVPRWNGDTNYMTVLGEVRVIPEHLKETYHRLRPYFVEFEKTSGGEG